MIVLEGPDLSGKSTIGYRLESLLKLKVYHFGGPPLDKEDLTNRIKYAPKNYIYDRHPAISEQIYGTIGNRRPLVESSVLTKYLIEKDPLIFYCNPGLEFLLSQLKYLVTKPHKKKTHIDKVKENYVHIYESYEKLMTSLSYVLFIVKVDFRTVTTNDIKEKINEYFRR